METRRKMVHHLKDIQEYGQSIWLDYIQRSLITGGRLEQLVLEGLRGITSNPSIFNKAIADSSDYDDAIRDILKSTPDIDTKTLYERLAIEDIRMAADVLRDVYDASGGIDGVVSLEASPDLAYDMDGTITEVRRLWRLVDRPNAMIKVPATPPGIPAIEKMIAEGININVTLIFSLKHYDAVARAYIRGIEKSPEPGRVTSVASFFVSRIDTYVDRELEKIGTEAALALRGRAAVANSKLAYRRFREVFFGEEFAAQRQRGARVQRALWGSTSTKNPAYSDLLYVEELIGPDTVNTLPMETIDAFKDHGKIRSALQKGVDEAEQVLADLERLGVDLGAITKQLQKDGVKAFADSFDQLLAALDEKRKR
jgi:transaldolase